jgi:hypothetical protein
MVDGQGVAVRIVEEGLVADAGIEGVAFELDPAGFQLALGGLEVVDVELDREVVGRNSMLKASTCIRAIVRFPVSNSPAGMLGAAYELG